MMTDLCLSGSSPQQQQSKEQLWVEIQEHKEELAVKEGCLEETARDLANLRMFNSSSALILFRYVFSVIRSLHDLEPCLFSHHRFINGDW
jgi:hypothetical protein